MNSFGLDIDDIETIRSIFAAHPEVETAILYGSRATGRFQPGSDIDLVLAGKNLTDRTILDIRVVLSDSNLPYLCDIVAENSISDANLKREIDETGKLFYATDKNKGKTAETLKNLRL
ncbi:MAG: nucleotidyltransferase domain-containing protein [Planctomycetaceae bacterium]|nr:nucleotidyltransferase domain-containing protein [Planctomycetaceae bacterium]